MLRLSIFLLPLAFFAQLNSQQNISLDEDMGSRFPPDSAQIAPPRYLGISGWQQCLEKERLNADLLVWCLPSEKPQECAESSWEELNALEGGERIANCIENSR